jgi:hypothetical protein
MISHVTCLPKDLHELKILQHCRMQNTKLSNHLCRELAIHFHVDVDCCCMSAEKGGIYKVSAKLISRLNSLSNASIQYPSTSFFSIKNLNPNMAINRSSNP